MVYCVHMKLKVEKIEKELERLDRSKSWLARKCGISRALLNYRLQNKILNGVEIIAKILDYDPKDLIEEDKS